MSKYLLIHLLCVLLVVAYVNGLSHQSIDEERKVYIVYMGNLPEGEYLARSHHMNMLQLLGHTNSMAEKIHVRSYTRSFNGFVVYLTEDEALKLKSFDGVVSVFKSQQFQTQTTRSWNYMGFLLNISRNLDLESNIIIGHLDSGILAESESFSDHGLSYVPKKWNGVCHGGKNFVCNKKLIGARYYSMATSSNYSNGHGTHTASIAAGNTVKNVSFYGIGNGTARGGVPSSRIATYTVCDGLLGCPSHDILAAFDDAIADKVDIITISIAFKERINISDDVIALGSFHAMQQNILTVNAVGNDGIDGLGSIGGSAAPWIFSVAASGDRKILNNLILGDGHKLNSVTVNSFDETIGNIGLIYGTRVTRQCKESLARQCTVDCVDPDLVKGKIILCDSSDLRVVLIAAYAGASGVIFREDKQSKDNAILVPIPTAILNEADFRYVESYLKSKASPSARITKSDIIHNHSPILASFSGKGPNKILPEIFKPDIAAPGINILAAYPFNYTLEEPVKNFHTLNSKYAFLSGTSMACPHIAGVAAYVKSKHPDWSPSAIKSALMTTASNMNGKYNLYAELGHGAGRVNPVKAPYPGLVYETSVDDYLKMLCTLGSSERKKLEKIYKGKKICPEGIKIYQRDLNYPAMTAPVHENSSFTIRFLRVVTNVGHANSTYHATSSTGDNTIYLNVKPSILSFVRLHERKSFVVTVTGQWLNQDHISSSLIWFDGSHEVRSPILLYRSSII